MFPWGAVIGAVATLGGSLLGSRSQSKASQQEGRATDQALQFEREKWELANRRYEEAQALQKARYEAWDRNRRGLLARYGLPMAGGGAPAAGGPAAAPLTLATMAGRVRPEMAAQPQPRPRGTLATLGGWEDWKRYM